MSDRESPDADERAGGRPGMGPGAGQRKERGGFNPGRLGESQRPASVIPTIVGGGPLPRTTPPPPLAASSSPAQRALREEREHPEAKGFTEVRIIGVGGGGGNALNRMIEAGVSGVEFIAVNTDPQALGTSETLKKLHIGSHVARRLGAGGDPTIGRRAAEESASAIEEAVAGADMVFITAGMGGGTGTGAAPVVAQLARQHRALTVGVVTLPFGFEGARRRRVAEEGIQRLREAVDALIVIPNDRLINLSERNTSMVQAFRRADDMLRHGVQGIADLVTVTGLINLDFADVRSVMENAGSALMALGEGNGVNRATEAAQAVINSPLLEHSISGASGLLLNVTGGPDLTLHEVSEIAQQITEVVSPDANIIFGAVVHPRPEAEVRVTLIATGMPDPTASQSQRPAARAIPFSSRPSVERPAPEPRPARPAPAAREPEGEYRTRYRESPRESERETRPARDTGREPMLLPDDADPLDVPPFLRGQRPR